MKTRLISFLLAILAFGSVQAQELSLSKFEETMEPDAVRFKVMDSNGVACALLKIGMVAKDPVFSGAVQSEYKEGEYWVYVPEGTESILIKSSNFVPFNCEFSAPVQSLFTYRLTIQPTGNGGGGGGGTTPKGETITISIPGTSESFDMVLVKAGMFEMGATPEQNSKENDENPVHWVKITKPYYIGETEVTQAVWEAVMGSNPSAFPEASNPVESVSWADAQRFINRLNGLTGKTFSLPTEAQWEYAARGGHKSMMKKFSGSNTPAEIGWSKENSMRRPHEVKTLQPNEIGIYDMSGNVWEMCLDFKNDYPKDTQIDPVQTKKSDNRVRRGGSWDGESEQMRNAYRRRITEDHASMDTGLRLVLQE